MRRLVLLRHGRTTFNAERRIQGQLDAELDATGHEQARVAARRLASYQPSLLWTSDLSRAARTAAYVGEACGLTPRPDARLREFHLGERQGTTHAEYAVAHPEEHAVYVSGRYDVAPGSETQEAVAERVVAALRELLAATPEAGTSIAVAHGAALRVGIVTLLGWPPASAIDLSALGNCHWAVLEQDAAGDRARLSAYNLGVEARSPSPQGYPDFATAEGVG